MITLKIMQTGLPENQSVSIQPATSSRNLCATGIDLLNVPGTKSTEHTCRTQNMEQFTGKPTNYHDDVSFSDICQTPQITPLH